MFTGIVEGSARVASVVERAEARRLTVELGDYAEGLVRGASVAIDGVCLTATTIEEGGLVAFDVIAPTLAATTLGELEPGDEVHVERSARFGDEIGGHLVSGHIGGTAVIERGERSESNVEFVLRPPAELMPYLFAKGFVALAGASLTIASLDRAAGVLSVWLIPETLRVTKFGSLRAGERVNIEADPQTVAIVETVQRVIASQE